MSAGLLLICLGMSVYNIHFKWIIHLSSIAVKLFQKDYGFDLFSMKPFRNRIAHDICSYMRACLLDAYAIFCFSVSSSIYRAHKISACVAPI